MGDSTAKSVAYEVTADGTNFIATMEKAAAASTAAADTIKAKFEGIGKAFESVQKTLLALTAVVAGGAFFKSAIDASNKLTGETLMLSKRLGITAEQAGVLNTALGNIGSDSDTYISAFDKFAKQIRKNEQGLNDMGLQTRDANGNLRDSNTLFTEALGKVGSYKAGLDQNTAAQTFFGKGIAEVTALQKLNNAVLEEAKKKNEELGLTITKENVEASKKYKMAMNDVDDVLTAVQKTIGDAVMPVFTDMANYFASTGPYVINVFKGALTGVLLVFRTIQAGVKVFVAIVSETINHLMDQLGNLSTLLAKVFSGDFAGAADVWAQMKQRFVTGIHNVVDASKDAFHEAQESFSQDLSRTWSKGTEVGMPKSGTNRMGEKDMSGGKGDESQMNKWQAELAEKKAAIQEQAALDGNFHQMSKEEERKYWQDILATIDVNSRNGVSVRRKIAEETTAIRKQEYEVYIESLNNERDELQKNFAQRTDVAVKAYQRTASLYGEESKEAKKAYGDVLAEHRKFVEQQQALAAVASDMRRNTLTADIELERVRVQQDLSLGIMNSQQALARELNFEERLTAIRKSALEERMALVIGTDNDPLAVAQLQAQLEQLERQHQQRLAEIRSKTVVDSQRDVTSTLGAIQSSWAGLIGKLMSGTITIGGVIKGMFQSVAQAVMDTLARLAAQWLVNQVLQRVLTKVTAASQITGNAAVAGAAATASAAAIPFYGWAIAPEAGAAVFASAMGYMGALASARGGYDIPASVNPLTQLHEKEMVLPARYADVIRQMADSNGAGGGGSSQPDIHLHVNAVDGQSVKRLLMDNQDHLATAMRAAHRGGAFWQK